MIGPARLRQARGPPTSCVGGRELCLVTSSLTGSETKSLAIALFSALVAVWSARTLPPVDAAFRLPRHLLMLSAHADLLGRATLTNPLLRRISPPAAFSCPFAL